MMLPLAAYRSATDPVLLRGEGTVSAGIFFARVRELAAALPDAPFVINLSESRSAFMLGFAAALVRGQTSLLPSGQGRSDWEQLRQRYPGAAIISDRTLDMPNAFNLMPYLAIAGMSHEAEQDAVLIPTIAADFAAAILFTSGSTGQPTAHTKSWGQLSHGAANLAVALNWTRSAPRAIVGSVPSQHMFGLETTVMLPWHAGIPVHASKPLLPADLEAAVAECARPCWWMTTPVHLRPPLRAATTMRDLAGIVASTMSLPPALAVAAEAKWQVPVVEIYGSTETGALATRRTASEEWWTPLGDVVLTRQLEGEAERIYATGPHIEGPVLLADELRFNPDGSFLWLGRSADMLKVGGKRASLSALNQRIAEIPGVDDAVYFVPDADGDAASHDDAHPARRLTAFYVSSTLVPEQVLAALRALVDPVFVPRPLIRVSQLPRNANGKLPRAALAALFSDSRTPTLVVPGASDDAVNSLVVHSDHPALPGHFPGNPIVPGVITLALMVDDIRRQLPHVVLGTLLTMRFLAPLRPDTPFTVHAEVRGERVHVEVRERGGRDARGTLLASGQWACAAGSPAGDRVGDA